MNDRIIYEILYEFIKNGLNNAEFSLDLVLDEQDFIWNIFTSSVFFSRNFGEIRHLIKSIAKDIDRKDKLKCQYCRLDEGFLVEPPLKSEDLCKKHRQEYEEQYIDRTLKQFPEGVSEFIGKEGLNCSGPSRVR